MYSLSKFFADVLDRRKYSWVTFNPSQLAIINSGLGDSHSHIRGMDNTSTSRENSSNRFWENGHLSGYSGGDKSLGFNWLTEVDGSVFSASFNLH